MDLHKISLSDYHYTLPEERIAQYPLTDRDQSKLLVYDHQGIRHYQFKQLVDQLPKHATLVFNDTQVVPARLYFEKSTGAVIEIFLLDPVLPSKDINIAMKSTSGTSWRCMIGNKKRWKTNQALHRSISIADKKVELMVTQTESNVVQFDWDAENVGFHEIVNAVGQVPLPPYLKREAEAIDESRYQTVYSKNDGAVAAPTAGLHFTKPLLQSLKNNGIYCEYLTLHVGAGTFQPIKEDSIVDHPMHREQMIISYQNLINLMDAKSLIAVGTTSLRTLESLYWYGVKLTHEPEASFHIEKLEPYDHHAELPGFNEALSNVKSYMDRNNLDHLAGYTEIFIFPPYNIKSVVGLITNFHLPSSTLILLVAALIGEDWKQVYQQALAHNYRFLSYGDSSLLMKPNHN